MAVITSMALPPPSTQAELETDARTDNEALLRLLREGGGTDFNDAGVGLDNLPPIKTVTPAPSPVVPAATLGNGVSKTQTEDFPREIGSLGGLGLTPAQSAAVNKISASNPNFASAFELAQALAPKPEPVNKWEESLKFWLNVGTLSADPKQTFLTAMSGAGKKSLEDLVARRKKAREVAAKTLPAAITIMGAMKPPKGTIKAYTLPDGTVKYFTSAQIQSLSPEDQGKLTPYSRPPAPSLKTPRFGTMAKYYKTKEEAEQFVLSQGLTRDNPNFGSTVKKFIAPNVDMVGDVKQSSGVFLEVAPLFRDGKVINLQIYPSKSAAAPRFQLYVEKRLPLLAKTMTGTNMQVTDVLPRVRSAMDLLRSGKVETGKLTETFLPLKQAFNQAFGGDDPQLMAIESLQATSNFIAPKMRPVGSGSTSDMEFRAYQRASLSIGNTPKSNYISLYAFNKMAENSKILNQKEQELLTDDRITSANLINKELNKIDTGIFEKYTGSREDTEEAKTEFKKWYDSLPDGAVIINNNLFPSEGNQPYLIKNWGK
jgi:hypothetical protein